MSRCESIAVFSLAIQTSASRRGSAYNGEWFARQTLIATVKKLWKGWQMSATRMKMETVLADEPHRAPFFRCGIIALPVTFSIVLTRAIKWSMNEAGLTLCKSMAKFAVVHSFPHRHSPRAQRLHWSNKVLCRQTKFRGHRNVNMGRRPVPIRKPDVVSDSRKLSELCWWCWSVSRWTLWGHTVFRTVEGLFEWPFLQ